MPQQDVKAKVKRYFAETDSQTGKWTCSCGKTLIQKKNTGRGNLFAHIKSQHKDYLPSPLEISEIQSIFSTMENFQPVTLTLQRESTCMADVRSIFEQMCIDYPNMSKYLKPDAKIIHSPDFENAINKNQHCTSDTLSEEEKEQLSKLEYPEASGREETQNPENESDFAASIIKNRKIATSVLRSQPRYLDSDFLLPPSNLLERFFSTAEYAYSDLRQNLLSQNLEMQLFLKINKKY